DLLLPTPSPPRPTPAVIYIHHGGWRNGDRSYGMYPWHGPLLAANGFVVANVSHRFSSQAPFPAQIYDVKAAVRWLRANATTYGIDPDRIGAWGDSSGGQLAALLGTTTGRAELEGDCGNPEWSSAVQAVVMRCAPSDFRNELREPAEVLDALFGGPPEQTARLRELASPLAHVHRGAPPFYIVHGTRDETVPFAQAESLAAALRAHDVDVTFRIMEGLRHNLQPDLDAPWGSEPWTDLGQDALAFFTRTLTG
ncbi:MAG TPA: alpha/beta hydrolase, partial [Mycobacteriales bacterium]|nr:alpha/beta hydrolase [Mycobacteriales bacterium]